MRRTILAAAVVLFAATSQAQVADLSKLAGYVDLQKYFNIDPETAETEVEIRNPLLSLVARATASDDEEFSQLLQNLQLIKVYTFTTNSQQRAGIKQRIESLDKKMLAQKWDRFLRVRDGDEITNGYLKSDGKKIDGFALFSLDAEETVLINIVGNLNIESLSRISKTFNLPKLDSLENQP